MLDEKEGLKDLLFGVYQDGQVYRSKFLAGIVCGAIRNNSQEEKCGGGGVVTVVVTVVTVVVVVYYGVVTVVVLRWCCCCVVEVLLRWSCCCAGGCATIVLLWWCSCGSVIAVADDPVSLTCRRLKFGVEYSECYLDGLMPFRRLLFQSDTDGTHITGDMLLDKIKSEEFNTLNDEDAVRICLLAVLHMVLL
ncbi:hypothetical protein Tco_1007942, partial [Tanacetum coccineum]